MNVILSPFKEKIPMILSSDIIGIIRKYLLPTKEIVRINKDKCLENLINYTWCIRFIFNSYTTAEMNIIKGSPYIRFQNGTWSLNWFYFKVFIIIKWM